jgi:hypothetical protein
MNENPWTWPALIAGAMLAAALLLLIRLLPRRDNE